MVSVSTPKGTVGPHIDQYDVFIIQGSGKRHWKVGDKALTHTEVTPHPALLHVEPFEPILDEILSAGDILYIPSGYPHDGVTVETAMSFSVGFRAPSCQHMLSDFADYLLENELGTHHYTDPNLTLRENVYEILPDELDAVKKTMLSVSNDANCFNQWFG